MMKMSSFAPPALHARWSSSNQALGLVLLLYLTTLFGTRKRFGKHASHTLLLNALGPGPLGLRLFSSR
jgi:hypothetical protein